jgi:xylulokinase
MSLLLAHDLGTSGVKSSLVTEKGSLIASWAGSYPTRSPDVRSREQDPEDWWAAIVANTRNLFSSNSGAVHDIAAIGVSGHMLGLVTVDRTGAVAMPALLHSDTRAHEEAQLVRAEVGEGAFYRITGNRLDARASLCKLLWVKSKRPAIYRRASRVLQSKDYIVGRLVGDFESTDYSDASHASFLDVSRGGYAEDLLATLGISPRVFPTCKAATSEAGTLCPSAARELGLPVGIPVAVGAGDGSSASIGAGAVEGGLHAVGAARDAYCCFGTTAWIAVCGENPVVDEQARVFNIMSAAGPRCDWFGTVQSAGASLEWAMAVLGVSTFDEAEALVASVPPGSDGVLFLPYLDGERSPIWDENARGVWFGMSSVHDRAHLLRAAMEGVSFALRSVLDVMRTHADIEALRFIGGGFRSRLLRQMAADILGVQLHAVGVPAENATSLGAALIAGTSVGIYPSLAEAVRCIPVAGVVEPGAEYESEYRRWRELYPALRTVFDRSS